MNTNSEIFSSKKNLIPVPSEKGTEVSFYSVPTDLEIGSGVGWHAISHSQQNPERQLIAIEHSEARFKSFAQRLANHAPIRGLLPVHANAVHWMAHYVPEKSLGNIFILFPNPYPKTKQSNKRWHNMPFMDFLLDRLIQGGKLVIATNISNYYEEALAVFRAQPKIAHIETIEYSLKKPAPWPVRTHFEKKYLNRGETCYQLTCTRV